MTFFQDPCSRYCAMNLRRIIGKRSRMYLVLCGLVLAVCSSSNVAAQDSSEVAETSADSGDTQSEVSEESAIDEASFVVQEQPADWEYMAPIQLAANELAGETAALVELKLGPDQFTHSRLDLSDLRVFTDGGKSHPYALRVLAKKSVRAEVPLKEFNRLQLDSGERELTLELLSDDFQHNEVRIDTTGTRFRRAVQVDGSSDGKSWQSLNTGHLVRFEYGDQKLNVIAVEYPDSRFRYVRVRVQPDLDPESTGSEGKDDEFTISSVKVLHTVDLPGERSEWPATVGPREPTRVLGAPGSAWVIDLNAKNVPVDRVEFEVANPEFVRDVEIQIESLSDYLGQPVFSTVYSTGPTTWQRKAGESKKWMAIDFPEVQTNRLRLLVCDYRNVPLTIRAAKVSAAARQVVIPAPDNVDSRLSLYFGNPFAEPANYDFARNLPEKLDNEPIATTLGAVTENPDFLPPPLPLTERYPWLVYVVLGGVAVVLLLIISSLARSAVAMHEAQA